MTSKTPAAAIFRIRSAADQSQIARFRLVIGGVLILLCLALWHIWLSVRSIVRPAVAVSASLHVIHLLSIPAIIIFYLLARLSTSFPGLFVNGIDADLSLKSGLEEAQFLGVFGLLAFVLTLFPALIAIHRAAANDNNRNG